MEIFGIGITQIIFIAMVALIIFGPERLPEIAGKIGRTVGDFRRVANQMQIQAAQTLPINQLNELKQEATNLSSAATGQTDQLKSQLGLPDKAERLV